MQRISLPDDRIQVEGAVEVDDTGAGITPRRLSGAYRHELPMEVDFLASSPSGVRLRFVTDAAEIGLEVLPTRIQIGNDAPVPANVDLVIGGELVERASTGDAGLLVKIDPADPTNLEFVPGEAGTVILHAPADGMRTVEVWLPQTCSLMVAAVHLADGAAVEAAPVDTRRRWVHHGSSISHCLEAEGPTGVWPVVAARLADVHLTNLGLAGQCHLDQFTARTIRDLPADVISIKVGVNVVNGDTLRLRTFPSALHGFLDTIRDGHPDTPILVVTAIFFPDAEDKVGPTIPDATGRVTARGTEANRLAGALTIKHTRELVAQVVAARVGAGDENLHLLSGLELFGEADVADLPDGLHPNGAGYQRMGERFAALAFADGGPLAS